MPNHPDSDRYFPYNESLLGLSTKMKIKYKPLAGQTIQIMCYLRFESSHSQTEFTI